ncbi:exopolysaccharide biosynthesis protein [Pelagibacterium mangrovi]|uniref:exopolysaccharide biosynthesis protein n=1 Tax=Pelagibacterium mangrovi TaxID=3119828 RepID=UPI002FCBE64D
MSDAVRSSGDRADNSDGPLAKLVDELKDRTENGEEVSIGLVQEIAGTRAAGPILLLPALIVISPLSIIPGLPSVVGVSTILVAGQVALGRDRLWLPQWLTKRCIPAKHGKTLLRFLTPVGETVDKLVKPRAEATAGPLFGRIGALVCVLVGAIMPVLELIPFTSTWAASIIFVYALAITVKDGFLALAWSGMVLGMLLAAWAILS